MKHPPGRYYWCSEGSNVYRERDEWKELAEDLQEFCGELLTEFEEARQ